MFEPIRGGTRGGQGDFKWSDVSADKDRENYLGHSINAPTGRWQKNKDVHWYSRDLKDSEAERLAEIRKIKEAEADALAVALGFTPEPRASKPDTGTGPISIPPGDGDKPPPPTDPQRIIEKEEKRQRKEEKRARKEERRAQKELRKESRRDQEARRRDRGDRGERGERGERSDRGDRGERSDRGDRGSRPRRQSPSRSRSRTPPMSASVNVREGGERDRQR
ncbi:kinase phosphorylation protein-domain-containing protein [Lentinula lateritia]|nr:kinase phosphorylation protein-domain-containing protein [Lentinula lateritia]